MRRQILTKLLALITDPAPEVSEIQLENRVHSNALLVNLFSQENAYLHDTQIGGYSCRSIGFKTSTPELDGSESRPILHLSPGGSRNAAGLASMAAILASEFNIPTVVTDNLGMGYSDGVLPNQDIYTFANSYALVSNNHFSGKHIIVGGHSKGGTVAQRALFDYISGKTNCAVTVSGYISIASGALNPVQEIIRQGPAVIVNAIRAILAGGRTSPIPFFMGKNNPLSVWRLRALFKAFAAEDSIKITQGMRDLNSEAPSREEVQHFIARNKKSVPAQLIYIDKDAIFPLLDINGRPGAIRRMLRWQSIGLGPAGLVFVPFDYGHSAPVLYPDLFAPYVAQAYRLIVDGKTGERENRLPRV